MQSTSAVSSIRMRVADLPAAQRFFVWAIRTWAAHHVDVAEAWAILDRAFIAERMSKALHPFDRMMRTIFAELARWPDIRCVRCPYVGNEEASLLESLAALQTGKPLVARNTLKRWVRLSALQRICAAGSECMAQASASGVCLNEHEHAVVRIDDSANPISQHGSHSRSLASQSTSRSTRCSAALRQHARAGESASRE